MKIAFDHTIFLIQKYGGISRYFIELQKKLLINNNVKILSPIYLNDYLKNEKNCLKLFKIEKIPKFSTQLINKFNYIFNEVNLKFWEPDIIHKTYFNNYNYKVKKAKKIINVWDLSHEIFHKMYNKSSSWRPKEDALKNVDHIICSSKKTQSDLIKFYEVDLHKTSVIYQGTPNMLRTLENCNLNLDYPYFLYVGSRKKYKNFEFVLKCFGLNKSFLKNFKLVCFGDEKFNENEINLINKLNINMDNIKLFSGSDKILVSLYKKAEALIYPSLNEGFGFPPLEAMKFGCSVIVSNNLAIQEAVGDCGFYFNPYDENSLIKSIEILLSNKKGKETKIKDGLERSDFFNWDKTSQDLINVYQKILS